MSIELTPELSPTFTVAVRGYDRAQVDEYIDWLKEWLGNATARMEAAEGESAELREEVRRLQSRIDDLETQVSGEPPRTIAALGERVTRMLELAEEGAAIVRADAESEAEQLGQRSRAEAEELGQRSRAEAEQLGQRSRAEAEQLVQRAGAEAEEMNRRTAARQTEMEAQLAAADQWAKQKVRDAEAAAAAAAAALTMEAEKRAVARKDEADRDAATREAQAEERAKQMLERAEEERGRVLQQLAAERQGLETQLAGLVAQRDEVLGALGKLHESLRTTIVERPVEAGRASGPGGVPAPAPTAAAGAVASGTPDPSGASGNGPSAPGRAQPADTEAGEDRTALFDREEVEDGDPGPAPVRPTFQRAGSQPAGSRRAGQ